ncbi:MAG: hypothetical protein GF355_17740, partial [Candidatus Eisenbacteria bacterium]|nr:hypothetical protein [Candidatus Eisenbacteria bacterium]
MTRHRLVCLTALCLLIASSYLLPRGTEAQEIDWDRLAQEARDDWVDYLQLVARADARGLYAWDRRQNELQAELTGAAARALLAGSVPGDIGATLEILAATDPEVW